MVKSNRRSQFKLLIVNLKYNLYIQKYLFIDFYYIEIKIYHVQCIG